MKLSIDIESFSDVDLTKSGVYKYAESPNFEILLFGYSVNDGPVQVVDLARGEKIPDSILQALSDEKVTKWAFNAMFERICLSVYLRRNYPQYFRSYSIDEDTVGAYLDPHGWKCSMTWAAYMGLPLSLKSVGEVLKLTEQKMDEGKALIRYFSIPCAPTASNGGRTKNLPIHDISKWLLFKEYNKRDVEVEMAIQQKLHKFPVPDFIWNEYWLDQEINDRGIRIDMDVVRNAIRIDEITRENLTAEMQDLTALDNPNSVQQMKEWLVQHGLEVDSLGKKEVQELLKTAPSGLAKVLMLRQQLAKSSVRKYQAMQNAVCGDSRARGMFQYYGANRTGRWCLAEGTMVLIKDSSGKIYEKPIESVLVSDMVFDGNKWVHHEGVVFSGEKEVITWDGITATSEHMVFIDASTKITLGEAKKRGVELWKGNCLEFTK